MFQVLLCVCRRVAQKSGVKEFTESLVNALEICMDRKTHSTTTLRSVKGQELQICIVIAKLVDTVTGSKGKEALQS